jgi:phosphatidylglycerophosphate synthase
MPNPWGILIPKKYAEKIFPKSKRDYANYFILHSILRRVSTLITFYLLKNTNIKPNAISFFQFLITFFISFCFANLNFILGASLLIFWVLLDNIDGELARLKNMESQLGASLERYNSDFMYALCIPSLSFGLYQAFQIEIEILFLSFISCAVYSVLRHFIATFPNKNFNTNNFLTMLIATQFKNMVNLRKKNRLGSFIFYTHRNIFSQVGLLEIIILFGSLMYYMNSQFILINIVCFYTFAYLFFDLIILVGLYYFINKN